MKTVILSTLAAFAVTATMTAAPFTTAQADTVRAKPVQLQIKKRSPRPARGLKVQQNGNSQAAGGHPGNHAKAWTAGCYAEFGPDAKWPDADLLQKCLDT